MRESRCSPSPTVVLGVITIQLGLSLIVASLTPLTRTRAVTAPVEIVNFLQYEGWEWGKIAAGGTLVMLPVVLFALVVRSYLVRGLTAGGFKE